MYDARDEKQIYFMQMKEVKNCQLKYGKITNEARLDLLKLFIKKRRKNLVNILSARKLRHAKKSLKLSPPNYEKMCFVVIKSSPKPLFKNPLPYFSLEIKEF